MHFCFHSIPDGIGSGIRRIGSPDLPDTQKGFENPTHHHLSPAPAADNHVPFTSLPLVLEEGELEEEVRTGYLQ